VTARVLLSHDNKSDACTSEQIAHRTARPQSKSNCLETGDFSGYVTFYAISEVFHSTAGIPWFASQLREGLKWGWSDVGGAYQRFREAKANFEFRGYRPDPDCRSQPGISSQRLKPA